MANLYDLSARYQQLLDQDELNADELAELESLHDNVEDECINRGKYIRNMEAEACAIMDAINEMGFRCQSLKHKIEKQKSTLIERMMDCNINKITKSPLFQISLKRNPVKLVEYNCDFIPDKYFTLTQPVPIKKLDKIAIKQDIQCGIEVPGCGLESSYRIDFK